MEYWDTVQEYTFYTQKSICSAQFQDKILEWLKTLQMCLKWWQWTCQKSASENLIKRENFVCVNGEPAPITGLYDDDELRSLNTRCGSIHCIAHTHIGPKMKEQICANEGWMGQTGAGNKWRKCASAAADAINAISDNLDNILACTFSTQPSDKRNLSKVRQTWSELYRKTAIKVN